MQEGGIVILLSLRTRLRSSLRSSTPECCQTYCIGEAKGPRAILDLEGSCHRGPKNESEDGSQEANAEVGHISQPKGCNEQSGEQSDKLRV
jgi:hypothetical protein